MSSSERAGQPGIRRYSAAIDARASIGVGAFRTLPPVCSGVDCGEGSDVVDADIAGQRVEVHLNEPAGVDTDINAFP